MPKFLVTDIQWDADGDTSELPTSLTLEADSEDELTDLVSDVTGYCHTGFNYLEITE